MTYHIARYLSTSNPSGVTNPPLAVYQFDGSVDYLKDRTANARDLTIAAGSFERYVDSASGLVGLLFNATEDHELDGPSTDALRVAKATDGSGSAALTIECIVKQTSYDGILFSCDSNGETADTNHLYHLRGSSLEYTSLNEYGTSGTDVNLTYAGATTRLNELVYIALTVDSTGVTRKLYVNGKLCSTATGNRAEKATSSNTQLLRIGRTSANDPDFKGYYYSFRITNETFGDSAVLEAYQGLAASETYVGASDYTGLSDLTEIPAIGGTLGYGLPLSGDAAGLGDENVLLPEGGSSHSFGVATAEGGASDYSYFSRYHHASCRDNTVVTEIDAPTWNTATVDVDGWPHFLFTLNYKSFYYDATNDDWNNPTTTAFTGYARNGKKYTAGVEDVGPVYAPWYSEVASNYRGVRDDFPIKSLHVLTSREWIIFDLDSFTGAVTSLKLWMRFILGSATTYCLLGAENYQTLRDVAFSNGVGYLACGTANGDPNNGRIFAISFKATGQDVFYAITSWDDWRAVAGKNITHRLNADNWTDAGTPNLRVASECNHSITARTVGNKCYVAVGGEDYDPTVITFTDGLATSSNSVTSEDYGSDNVNSEYRKMWFDYRGWLWYSIDNRLFRSTKDHTQGTLAAGHVGKKWFKIYKAVSYADLPSRIRCIVADSNTIYVGTVDGIYVVDAATFSYHLAYTAPGYGGRGVTNVEGAGAILNGGVNSIESLEIVRATYGSTNYSYLIVTTQLAATANGGVYVIRLFDDTMISALAYSATGGMGSRFSTPWLIT